MVSVMWRWGDGEVWGDSEVWCDGEVLCEGENIVKTTIMCKCNDVYEVHYLHNDELIFISKPQFIIVNGKQAQFVTERLLKITNIHDFLQKQKTPGHSLVHYDTNPIKYIY